MKRILAVTVVAAFAVGCSDSSLQDPGAPNIAVSDGAHIAANGSLGNQGFYFLPPLVETPEYDGRFNPYLRPSVEVVHLGEWEWNADSTQKLLKYDPVVLACGDSSIIAEFGPDMIAVDAVGERYSVGWNTDATVVGHDYRICVQAEGQYLGYRDVRPDENGSDVPRNTSQLPVFEYNHGSNLPIKFRIEAGALCDIDGVEVRDCTVARLDSDGGTAVCDNATCSLAVPTGAITEGQEFLFIIERLKCTYGETPEGDKYVNYLNIDLPQYGGCMRITATGGSTQFVGLNTAAIAAACIDTDLDFPQDDYLQLHIQYPDNNVEALPTAASDALECDNFTNGTNGIQVTSLGGRLLNYASNSWSGVQRALGPWFSPPPLEATHKGFGGSTTLSCTDAPSVSGADGPMLAGTSTSCTPPSSAMAGLNPAQDPPATPEPAVALLAWALPAQMEKYQWVNPKIAAMGDVVTATVKVWDDPTASGYPDYAPRPVAGAWVNFKVAQGDPLVPEVVRRRTGSDGTASVDWPLYPDGQLLLDATGFGIGTAEGDSTGAYADHLGGPFLLGEGKVTFEALACGPGIDQLDGSIEGEPYILVTDQALANLSGGDAPMEVYYSYDCDNIYFAVRVQASADLNNTIRIVFDDDNDGQAEEFDDVLSFEKDKQGVWHINDWWLTEKCIGSKQASCGEVDPQGAMPDAKVGYDGTWFTYEIQRPYGGTDKYDIENLELGDTVGFYLALQLGNGAQGNTEWPGFRIYHPLTLGPGPAVQ